MNEQFTRLKEIHDAKEWNDGFLSDLIMELADLGFKPGLYYTGKYWRAHVQVGTNVWHDGRTPSSAFYGAIKRQLTFMRRSPPC